MLLAIDFTNLHEILQALYQDMMPLCEKLTGVAKGIAGLGALFYVAAKVWQAPPVPSPSTCTRCCAVRHRAVHPLLPHLRHRHDQHGALARGEGLPRDARITDLRHEPIPGTEGDAGEEAFRRDPEKAYLASKEDFDKKLDELGWSPKDLKTMAVMYIDRTEYNMKRSIRLWLKTARTAVPVGCAGHRHDTDVLPDRPLHPRSDSVRPLGL